MNILIYAVCAVAWLFVATFTFFFLKNIDKDYYYYNVGLSHEFVAFFWPLYWVMHFAWRVACKVSPPEEGQ